MLLAASPLVAGISGTYFEDGQEAPLVEGRDAEVGVARWPIDPKTADTLWELFLKAFNEPVAP